MNNNFFTLAILPINILLCIVYLTKKKIKCFETITYKYICISSLITNLLAITSYFTIMNINKFPVLNEISNKLLLLSYLVWMLLFTCYLIGVSNKKLFTNIDLLKINQVKLVILSFIVCISVSPIEYNIKNNVVYSEGIAPLMVYILAFIMIIIWLVIIFKNRKRLLNKKFYPLYVMLFIGLLTVITQYYIPELLMITYLIGFITLLMYFTIENPDYLLINELELTKNNLEKANNVKTEFLRSMSHELRTPMNQIIGLSDLLVTDENLKVETKETIIELNDVLKELLCIFTGIIDVEQIESGIVDLNIIKYEPKKIMEELNKLFGDYIKRKGLDFVCYVDNETETLYGDKNKIKQIIANLLENSIKYTKSGKIELNINTRIDNNNCNLEIRITDTGCGISKEEINNIFDKFFRTEEVKNTSTSGMGLGLYIVKELVNIQNGTIEVESKENEGTTFIVNLKQYLNKPLSKSKALIITYNKGMYDKLSEMLESFEIKSIYSDSYILAEDIIKDYDIDIIIIDKITCNIGAKEYALKCKNNNFNGKIITINKENEEVICDLYNGVIYDKYINEPITIDKISKIIN